MLESVCKHVPEPYNKFKLNFISKSIIITEKSMRNYM